jgi:hypothetical protein
MEVQQCMKFTGTNSSIGLIVLISNAYRKCDGFRRKAGGWHKTASRNNMLFADLVVMAERLHPIPFRTRP